MGNKVQKSFAGGAGLTITFPAGVHTATFKGVGGGGGGGGGGGTDAAGGNSGGGGGGGGAAVLDEITIPIISGRLYNIVLGAAGLGGNGVVSGAGQNGTPGGDTTVIDSVSGFVLCAFRGASGGTGGSNVTTGGVGGAYFSTGSPAQNILDEAVGFVDTTATKVSTPLCGGAGGDAGASGFNGGYAQLQDSTIVATAPPLFTGGTGGVAVAVNGGGGGGGGASALGPGGNGGHGGNPAGVNGSLPPGAATGAGGGGGGGSFHDGVARPGGNGANGTTGSLLVTYDVAA